MNRSELTRLGNIIHESATGTITVSTPYRSPFSDEYTEENETVSIVRVWDASGCTVMGWEVREFPDPVELTADETGKLQQHQIKSDYVRCGKLITLRTVAQKLLEMRDRERARTWKKNPLPTELVPSKIAPDGDSLRSGNMEVVVPKSQFSVQVLHGYITSIVPEKLELHGEWLGSDYDSTMLTLERVGSYDGDLKGWLVSWTSVDPRLLPLSDLHAGNVPFLTLGFPKIFRLTVLVQITDEGQVVWSYLPRRGDQDALRGFRSDSTGYFGTSVSDNSPTEGLSLPQNAK